MKAPFLITYSIPFAVARAATAFGQQFPKRQRNSPVSRDSSRTQPLQKECDTNTNQFQTPSSPEPLRLKPFQQHGSPFPAELKRSFGKRFLVGFSNHFWFRQPIPDQNTNQSIPEADSSPVRKPGFQQKIPAIFKNRIPKTFPIHLQKPEFPKNPIPVHLQQPKFQQQIPSSFNNQDSKKIPSSLTRFNQIPNPLNNQDSKKDSPNKTPFQKPDSNNNSSPPSKKGIPQPLPQNSQPVPSFDPFRRSIPHDSVTESSSLKPFPPGASALWGASPSLNSSTVPTALR
ncbi:uncharacterized protein LOC119568079 [Penaeus monodon]|uniref:uncharacterized protein LOC119568079 n=1 Tax=Penaeus monodon TaxID=6687 RepID=UPI0018A7A2AF|nr:uncharacterized protein LOC119568079 [Penaeus monodon]